MCGGGQGWWAFNAVDGWELKWSHWISWFGNNLFQTYSELGKRVKNWFLAKINGTKPMHVFTACGVLEILIIIFRKKQN